jgi:hypothetical protein
MVATTAKPVSRWNAHPVLGYEAGDTNLQRYVGNSPPNATDPSGLHKVDVHSLVTLEAALEFFALHPGRRNLIDKWALQTGAVSPDLKQGASVIANVPVTRILQLRNRVISAIPQSVVEANEAVSEWGWENSKSIGKWVSSSLYDKLRGLRNWWQDTHSAPYIVEQADKVAKSVNGETDLKNSELYQSHFGENVWHHAMTDGSLSAVEFTDKLLDRLTGRIELHRMLIEAEDVEAASFALGEAIHTLQDSYSASHVTRDSQGRISQYQDWLVQSPGLHGVADAISDQSTEWATLTKQTKFFLSLSTNTNLSGIRLREALRQRFFMLAPGATTGGTHQHYSPRK